MGAGDEGDPDEGIEEHMIGPDRGHFTLENGVELTTPSGPDPG